MRWSKVLVLLCFGSPSCSSELEHSPCDDTPNSVKGVHLARRQDTLSGTCVEQMEIEADPTSGRFGQVPCTIAEVFPKGDPACACTAPGYAPLPNDLAANVESLLRNEDPCKPDESRRELCLCEFLQLSGSDLELCWSGADRDLPTSEKPVGWCYYDVPTGFGSAAVENRRGCSNGFRQLPENERISYHRVIVCAG
jgi:hypothetical protein